MTSLPCPIEGCTRAVWSRGLCNTHYAAARKSGQLNKLTYVDTCELEDCERTDIQGNSLCHMHYMRLRRTGTTDKLPPRQQATPEQVKANKKARDQRYRQSNPETVRAGKRRYYGTNPEVRAAKSAYHYANQEAKNEYTRQWRAANPEKSRQGSRTRRARKAGVVTEPWTTAEVILLYGTICHLCGVEIDMSAPRKVGTPGWEFGYQDDHVIPIAEGGPDTLSNIRPSHGLCNLRKGKTYAS